MCHIIKTLKTITLALPEMGYYYHHYKATNFGRHQLHHENDEGDWNISFFSRDDDFSAWSSNKAETWQVKFEVFHL